MSPLERLGLEVVAFTLLGSRWQAAMLMTLLDAKGQTCGWERLASARAWRLNREGEDDTRQSTQCRVRFLRTSMDDIGLGGLIHTVGHVVGSRDKALGYSIPEPGRTQIIERLISEAV